jgi:hypothetical protein
VLSALVACSAAACDDPPVDEEEETTAAEAALYRGTDDLVYEPGGPFAIVALKLRWHIDGLPGRLQPRDAACGATLIASNVAITAAHCVDRHESGSVVLLPTSVEINLGGFGRDDPDKPLLADGTEPTSTTSFFRFGDGSNGRRLVDVAVHRDWADGDRGPATDVAIIVFDPPVYEGVIDTVPVAMTLDFPDPVEAALISPWEHAVTTGESCFGTDEEGNPPSATLEPPRLLAMDAEPTYSHDGDQGLWDLALDWAENPDESGFCHGDSGSPMIAGAAGVISVLARGLAVGDGDGPVLTVGGAREIATRGMDHDGDGVPAQQDSCDAVFNPPPSPFQPQNDDEDEDGVGDPCDHCPTIADEYTENRERDGDDVLSCLDPCPDDAPGPFAQLCNGRKYGDDDCDGICNVADVCRNLSNFDRHNSNELVETRHGVEAYPDACEPVLVPDIEPGLRRTTDSVGFETTFIDMRWTRYIANQFELTARRSRAAPGLSPTSLTPDDVETHLRFCQNDPLSPCRSTPNVNYDLLKLNELEDDDDRWHRITRSASGAVRGDAVLFDYDDSTTTLTWDYEADQAYWEARGFIVAEDEEILVPGQASYVTSGLRGVLWAHADDNTGHYGFDMGTGTHGETDFQGKPQLAGDYLVFDPEYSSLSGASRGLLEDRPFFIWQTLVDPPPWEGALADRVRPDDVVVIAPGVEETWGIRQLDGRIQLADVLGERLREQLATPGLAWAQGAEVWPAQGGFSTEPGAMPVAIAIDPVDRTIVEDVQLGDGFLAGRGDRRGDPPAPTAQTAAAATAPQSVAAYSRALRQAWLLSDGKAYWTSVDATDKLFEKPLSEPLGDVLAAVVSTFDGMLWALDEMAEGQGTRRRLIRIDPLSGKVSVLASRGGVPQYERYWLGLDREGRVLLQATRGGGATPPSPGHHTVLTAWVADDALQLQREHRGDGALAWPAVVHPSATVLYLMRRGEIAGERFEPLDGAAFPSGQLQSVL